jgi:hypothetical protein
MWQVFHEKLQTGGRTQKNILFTCPGAAFVWTCFKEVFGWDKVPLDFQDCMEGWIPLGCDNYKLKLFILGVVSWILWITRNKFAIEGVCPMHHLIFYTKFSHICSGGASC